MIFVWLATAIATAGGLYAAWRLWRSDGNDLHWFGAVLGVLTICCGLLFVGLLTMGSGSVQDGCYRISSTTSTGTTVVPTGKSVIAVPTIINSRSYTPIACPS